MRHPARNNGVVLPQPLISQQTHLKPVDLFGQSLQPIALGRDAPPMLQVIIDAEEEFDWSQPFDRRNIAVENLAHQEKAQRIFERHGVRPTYVVDYAVASQEQAFAPLRAIMARISSRGSIRRSTMPSKRAIASAVPSPAICRRS